MFVLNSSKEQGSSLDRCWNPFLRAVSFLSCKNEKLRFLERSSTQASVKSLGIHGSRVAATVQIPHPPRSDRWRPLLLRVLRFGMSRRRNKDSSGYGCANC